MKKLVALMLSALTVVGLTAALAATTAVPVTTPATREELREAELAVNTAKKQLHSDY